MHTKLSLVPYNTKKISRIVGGRVHRGDSPQFANVRFVAIDILCTYYSKIVVVRGGFLLLRRILKELFWCNFIHLFKKIIMFMERNIL